MCAVSDAAQLQAQNCRFCTFSALSHRCIEPGQRSEKRQATNSALTRLHPLTDSLIQKSGSLKKSFWSDQWLDIGQSKGGN